MTPQMPDGSRAPPRGDPQQIVQPGDRRLDAPLVRQPLRRAAHHQHRPERDDERHDAQLGDEHAVDEAAQRAGGDRAERGDERARRPLRSSSAMTTVLSAMIEPTDRSMPPATITTVMPSAAMQTIAVCRAISSRLAGAKNCGPTSAPKMRRRATRPRERAAALEERPRRHATARAAGRGHHQLVLGQRVRPARARSSRPRRITAMRSHSRAAPADSC